MNFTERKYFFFFLLPLCLSICAGKNTDSLFIDSVKKFFYAETGDTLKGDFFTRYMKEDKALIYLYVSRTDKVEKPGDVNERFIFCRSDSAYFLQREKEFKEKGYQTSCYRTWGNSASLLSHHLLSYSRYDLAFVVLHELMHNYLTQHHIKIPYTLEEAFCDVTGNVLREKFFQSKSKTEKEQCYRQIKTMEKIYSVYNKYTEEINRKTAAASSLHKKCETEVKPLLKKSGVYYNDRYNYNVNNAFLLKNSYYCNNYFMLKDALKKAGSLKIFLETIRILPQDEQQCRSILLSGN